ncbi:hypothetical protein QBC37DRAFT_181667 [Rhypophila decipiens]|uniref:Rhodopsin domain-containing protein n=1 Tax=Rhypophila decipiens TaxID=261697 RepID=A0AAN6Y5D8_9PEZI|nr:hypothetical protein QBC37DRAFT_181667 [Rhypophila decipiens]
MIYAVGIAVATYFETPRIGEQWTDTLDGRTLVPVPWWQLQSALTVLLDLYIFVLPLPVLAKLNLPMRRKLGLTAVFSLALMGIAASIASLVQRIQITHSNDPTWIAAVLSLCSAVEMNVSIIVSSAPAFANFARIHLSNMTDGTLLTSLLRLSGLSRYGGGSRHDAAGTSRGIRLDADSEAMASSTQLQHDGQSGQKNNQFYELELNETWVGKTGSGVSTTTATTANHGNRRESCAGR